MIGDVYEGRADASIIFRIKSLDASDETILTDGTGADAVGNGLRDLLIAELTDAAYVRDLAVDVLVKITPVPAGGPPPVPYVGRHTQLALFDI